MDARWRRVMSALGRRGPLLGTYAVAVVLVAWGTSGPSAWGPAPRSTDAALDAASASPRGVQPPASAPAEAAEGLTGIWQRYEPGGQGARVRFYYFHGDGTGLYRYGRVGLTNTHGLDYRVEDDRLVLDFRKTGEHHEVRFVLRHQPDRSRDWLELVDDPREPGPTRYFREPRPATAEPAPASGGSGPAQGLGPAPAGHTWIDLRSFAAGGQGFGMYQLRAAGIDGRGVGWFHRGDFDEWSTESLTYRIVGDRIELEFSLAGQRDTSSFTIITDPDGTRWLWLADDPRDFWHPRRYADMGPSFGAALSPWSLGVGAPDSPEGATPGAGPE